MADDEIVVKATNNPSPPDESSFVVPEKNLSISLDEVQAYGDVVTYKTNSGTESFVRDGNAKLELASRDVNRSVNFPAPESGADTTTSDQLTNSVLSSSDENNNLTNYYQQSEVNKTIKVVGGSDATSQSRNLTSTRDSSILVNVPINPEENELSKFSSYTYNIALYLVNSTSYVNLMTAPNNPQQVLNDGLLLMRSGGVGNDNMDTEFGNDFFIDNLEIDNIAVGPSKFKQNTNATNIKFSIIEPRGVTLLERLRDAAGSVLNSTKERYIHAPYLLEITFKGYDELGRIVPADSRPKYIPIRITDMQFDVSEAGTEYVVEAIPFAHHVFGHITSTIPINIELSAKTVGDVFDSTVKSFQISQNDQRDIDNPNVELNRTNYIDVGDTLGDILTQNQIRRTQEVVKKSDQRTGPPGPSGGFEETTIPPDADGYDTFKFSISPEIANAKLNLNQLFDALKVPAKRGTGKSDEKANMDQFETYARQFVGNVSLDKDLKTFKINAGTDIVKLLNLLVMHSSYMTDNVLENAPQPVKWFKVTPYIESAEGKGKGFDGKDGRYKYNIVYRVSSTIIHHHNFPWAPKSKPAGIGVHKIYDYIYSGNNTEVTGFKLKFNTAFVQVMTAKTGKPDSQRYSYTDDFVPLTNSTTINTQGDTINPDQNLLSSRAKDLFSSVMHDGVDLIDLEIDILGDPSYIPTSDAYWEDKMRQGSMYPTAYMPDGTINYDLGPPYVQINLKTPTDYDPRSGLADPTGANSISSSFSGIYRVTSVNSTFSGGQFIQRVYGIRTTNEPAGSITTNNSVYANNIIERNVTTTDGASSGAVNGIANNVNNTAIKHELSSGVQAKVNGRISELSDDAIESSTTNITQTTGNSVTDFNELTTTDASSVLRTGPHP